jgi:hypothetical protein
MSESLANPSLSPALQAAFEGFTGFSPESTRAAAASEAALKAEDQSEEYILAGIEEAAIVVPGVLSAVRINGLLDGLSGKQRTELILAAVEDE